MKQVKFVCRTCEKQNSTRHQTGLYKVQAEFESFTDAWAHIEDSIEGEYAYRHDMIAVLDEEGK